MVASTLPSNSTLIDGNATWNRSHKSGSTTVLDRNTASSKRSSTFELHSMGDKMSISNADFSVAKMGPNGFNFF